LINARNSHKHVSKEEIQKVTSQWRKKGE